MRDLEQLIERVEKLTGPSEEMDAHILCTLAAPAGAFVEQSLINGAWCIHSGRAGGWPITASLDAAIALTERLLPGCDICWQDFHTDFLQ